MKWKVIALGSIFLFVTLGVGLWHIFVASSQQTAVTVPKQTEQTDRYTHESSKFHVSVTAPEQHTGEEDIVAAVVPHHMIAESVIEDTLARVATQKKNIKRVILVAPNHNDIGPTSITSDGDWDTYDGVVKADSIVTNVLVKNNLATVDRAIMEHEHGIFTLVPFVAAYFPKASIVPVIVRESIDPGQLDALAQTLASSSDEKTLFILSADFSHYLPHELTAFHDHAALTALYNSDTSFVPRMEVDTWPGVSILLTYVQARQAERFSLVKQSNSWLETGVEDASGTTGYISGYFSRGEKQPLASVSLLAVGDIMLDRTVLTKTKEGGSFDFPFLLFDRMARGVDIRLANLEGPITTNQSVAEQQRFTFTFSPAFLEPLKKRFDILSLANNHTDNFGAKGLEQTRKFLTDSGITFFGDPYNAAGKISTIVEENGLKIAFVGYHELTGVGFDRVISEVKRLDTEVDSVIVMPHWGVEYQTDKPSSAQKYEAHALIDAGADIIIGAHPHVVQPLEVYNDRMIFYSLGNFIFDQYFSVDTMQGLAVGISMTKEYTTMHYTFSLFPLTINNKSQPGLADKQTKEAMLKRLTTTSLLSPELKTQLTEGKIDL